MGLQEMVDHLKNLEDRTDAKLRFAKLHLDELKSGPRGGCDFERAHQESFLFHFVGVLDAFYQEINKVQELGFGVEKVRINSMEERLEKQSEESQALIEIRGLLNDKTSWLARAKEVRDQPTHRGANPRIFHVGGEQDGTIQLKQFADDKEGLGKMDYLDLYAEWLQQMKALVLDLREKR